MAWNFRGIWKGFYYAFKGLAIAFRREAHFRFHVFAAGSALILGIIVRLDLYAWSLVVLSIAMVLAAELFNSSIEELSDAVSTKKNKAIARAKDMAAAGVLTVSLGASVVGVVFILIPLFRMITAYFNSL